MKILLSELKYVWIPPESSPLERLAAEEFRRYLYVLTGRAPELAAYPGTGASHGIWVGTAEKVPQEYRLAFSDLPTAPGSYSIRTLSPDRIVVVQSANEQGVLYGAYRLLEYMGIRFQIHGDILPDLLGSMFLPELEVSEEPLFSLRGLNAWGSHAEGIDLWNEDDYKSVITQMTKMRMNFFGIHGYPEAPPGAGKHPYGAEPIVWTGLPEDVSPDGSVLSAYKSSLFNTLRSGWWGYSAKPTSEYSFGGNLLFEKDDWGSEVMDGLSPEPSSEADQVELFNRLGRLFASAFSLARDLGVRTAVGTETPLTIPDALKARLLKEGRHPDDPSITFDLYRGMFERLKRAHCLDYYWIWTPESWTWVGASDAAVSRTLDDIRAAVRAKDSVDAPFSLATAGWVLGPPQNRALFHEQLPASIAVAEIARVLGMFPIDETFGQIQGRSKWAIPWLEGDPALTSPQLWVGRVRKDASDALKYGCEGLMGLHWRTRIVAPNASALAQAAWVQSDWLNPGLAQDGQAFGATGGAHRTITGPQGAGLEPLYKSYRLDVHSYRVPVPAGIVQVTLHFLEPMFAVEGARIFDVRIQGRTEIEGLDCFAVAGLRRPIVRIVKDVSVPEGVLDIEFIGGSSLPVVCAIEVENEEFSFKVDCGGAGVGDFQSDWPDLAGMPDRHAECADFYYDWACAEFGDEAGKAAARIFIALDGRFPVTSDWVGGAGGIVADNRPWAEASSQFDFVSQFESLAPLISGPRARARFDFWRNIFTYSKAQGRCKCALGAFESAMATVESFPDHEQSAFAEYIGVPAYTHLLMCAEKAYQALLASIETTGCIGNLLNWEGHIWKDLVDQTGERLSIALRCPLPATLRPRKDYSGPAKLIVPTVRTLVGPDEDLRVRAIFLDKCLPQSLSLFWRRLGKGEFSSIAFRPVGRAVFEAVLPAAQREGCFEYYVIGAASDGASLVFPPGAPTVGQTVVVWP